MRIITQNYNKWVSNNHQSQPEDVIWNVADKSTHPYQTTITINNQPLQMKIDTGAVVSPISKDQVDKCFPTVPLEHSLVVLRTYTAQSIPVLGVISVDVSHPLY